MANAVLKDKEFKKFLKTISLTLKQRKKLGRHISPIVFKDVIKHFEKEQGEGGKPWKPWSKTYSTFLAKTGKGGNKILQFSGRMRQSFFPSSFRTMSNGFLWFNPAKTKKGFPYAAAHDIGGPILPQREFMWLSANAIETMARAVLTLMLKRA